MSAEGGGKRKKDGVHQSGPGMKRPRKQASNAGPSFDQVRRCQELFELIRNSRGSDNRLLCEHFMRAPSRRSAPEFYKLIAQPIDVARIQQKAKTEEYGSIDGLCADFELLVSNAKLFYKEDQPEYKDACDLWEAVISKRKQILEEEVAVDDPSKLRSSTSSPFARGVPRKRDASSPASSVGSSVGGSGDAPVSGAVLEEMIAAILDLTDESGRLLSPPFRLLMSPEDFPAYYQVIKEPMDLKTIAQRVRAQHYRSLNEMERDIKLMCKNAKMFNEPGSVIHKDASVILKFFAKRKAELSNPSAHPSAARAEHNAEVIDELLRQTPSEEGDVDYSEDSDEDEATEESRDPRWILYWTVRNAVDTKAADPDATLADPFLELPSRSYYPDYYEEVHDPMSLFMINKKLKSGAYDDLSALLDDVILVFANAKAYNMDGSDIHDAACRLERIALAKAKQLQPSIDVSQYLPMGTHVDSHLATARDAPMKPPSVASPKPSSSTGSSTATPVATVRRPHRRRESGEPRAKRGRKSIDELMQIYRNKLLSVWESLHAYRDGTRWVAEQFMHLPPKKLYPDYYKVIPEPIDLAMIRDNILNDKYESSEAFASDFELLFGNARHYNESESQIYTDANRLEAIFGQEMRKLGIQSLESPKIAKRKYGTQPPSSSTTAPTASSEHASAAASATKKPAKVVTATATEDHAQWEIFTAIKDYRDPYDRQLCRAFIRLPSRQEYPDYYEVIRKPMDMTKIAQRLQTSSYENVDALCADFILMFDNACRYNEPESYIYKDALSLQRILLQKKAELCAEESSALPDVQQELRNLLTSLFIAVNNHQDSDQRCYSDSLTELPALLRKMQQETKAGEEPEQHVPSSLDEIKRNIDMGRYRRLDRFQDDVFALLNKARDLSRSDSQLFEDTVELQAHYIRSRDELCRNRLISPALNFTERHLLLSVDAVRKRKQPIEASEDAQLAPSQTLGDKADGDTELDRVVSDDVEYRVRSFAYVAPSSDNPPGGAASSSPRAQKGASSHIMRIERLYRDSDGRCFARGVWCYRPMETFHLAKRKFLPNEVFLTPYFDTITVDRLQGKCLVVFIRQYLKFKAVGFDEKDVYVCESRYLGRQLHFKKIKQWPYVKDEEELGIEFEERSEPLNPVRVSSVFVNQKPPSTSSSDEETNTESLDSEPVTTTEDDATAVLEKQREEIVLPTATGNAIGEGANANSAPPSASTGGGGGEIFYEQICHRGIWLQLGDAIRVVNPEKSHDDILRVDKLWRTPNGDAFVSGPWFARPVEIEHEPSRMFYKHELFAVEQGDMVASLNAVRSRAVVMPLRDFCRLRPTEIPERDVFLVQFKVAGRDRSVGRCSISNVVGAQQLQGQRGSSESAAQRSAENATPVECQNDGGGDGDDESSVNSPPPTMSAAEYAMSEASARPIKKLKSYHLSDKVLDDEIFLFKTPIVPEKEMSPLLMKADTSVNMEGMDVEDDAASVSLEGTEKMSSKELASWLAAQPKLNSRSKSGYILFSAEIRKRIMAENPDAGFGDVSKKVGVEWKKLTEEEKKQYEVRADYIAKERAKAEVLQPTAASRLQPGQIRVHCCRWQSCDHQFDDQESLYEHVKNSHTSQIVDGENQYVCLWTSCLKYRINGKPFPSLPRLHRHIKEKHLSSSVKSIYPNQKSKNYCGNTPIAQSPGLPMSGTHSVLGNFLAPGGSGTFVMTPAGLVPHVSGDAHPHHHPSTSAASANAATTSTVSGLVHHLHHPGHHHLPSNHPHFPPSTPHSASSLHPSASSSSMGAVGGATMVQALPPGAVAYGSGAIPVSATTSLAQQDPGRMIVHAAKPPEPVFVAPTNAVNVKRVMHSEVYLRYIESLNDERQHTVSKWDRALTQRTATTSSQRPLPVHWLRAARNAHPIVKEENLVKALWQLRDRLIEDTLGISREVQYTGPL